MEHGVRHSAPHEELEALVTTAVDAIVSIDRFGLVRLANPATEKMFGWSAGELIGNKVNMLMPEGHAAHHDAYVQRYLDGGEARIIGIGRRVRGKHKDGTEFPVHLSVGEFSVEGDRYFVGILRDLTEEQREHARLQQLEDQLALFARRSAVSEMGASLAHELNQPLTAIDLFLTAAKRAFGADPDKALTLFEEARREAQRAGEIIRRIRKMVEGNSGRKEVFPLKPVIEDAIDLCRISDETNPARFEVVGADEALVLGDEIQIRQVLVNLIKNALEATAGQPDRWIRIDVACHHYVTVDVTDNGPGVAQDVAARLFEPFQSTKAEGLGIGLSICRTIAENHGGELLHIPVAIAGQGGGGACFRLKLPEADQKTASDE
ncbi:two-component oxygen-sensor histidine kinase [Parvularcula bermudensis HTCC2503]|uniref:Sensor protein FixL n=1 Tax=Parvularcula bermudensis (strain ATCC BAA-594 / HTCC2503 / KCTC 12087) TaxID=314260 RepID=E0TFD5_PARBH|nr:PAS domain-containing sensor histidine kinase [Parvularcula bermudensis]ADM09536.1 two-component oxygen-sensor histidine kinase [Parvularcula bermudensis HTCC2503]